jgi:hypothetical protein
MSVLSLADIAERNPLLAQRLDEHDPNWRAEAAVADELLEEARDVLEWRLGYADPARVLRLARLLAEWRVKSGEGAP